MLGKMNSIDFHSIKSNGAYRLFGNQHSSKYFICVQKKNELENISLSKKAEPIYYMLQNPNVVGGKYSLNHKLSTKLCK